MSPSRIRVPDLREKKSRGEKIAMLTAYDATMARLLDQAGVDALLVGDSVAMVVLGYGNTLSVTLDAMLPGRRAQDDEDQPRPGMIIAVESAHR